MARDGAGNGADGGIATLERVDEAEGPNIAPSASLENAKLEQRAKDKRTKDKKKAKDEEVEYEWELATPFGKMEFELEPASSKERRDQRKKEDAEKAAARAAAKAAKRAEKRAAKAGAEIIEQRRGSMLVPMLILAGLIVAAVAVAIWLFARPGNQDEIPSEFRNDESEPEPAGFVSKARSRVTHAVRAGRRASRESQDEQQRKYEELTHGGGVG